MEKKLTELSNIELENRLRNTKLIIGVFIGMMVLMIMIGVFDFINTKRFSTIFISAVGMIFFAAYLYRKMTKISAEIKSRENK